jgi:HPr kinase/phosphorylase
MTSSTSHGSAVLVGARAVLIQGPAGSGKSRLAYALIEAARNGLVPFARLVADDRVHLEAAHGRLIARPAEKLAGLIEIRGLGIRRLAFESMAVVGLLVELEAADAARLPQPERRQSFLADVLLPRLSVASGADPLGLVVAALHTADSGL